LMTDALYGQPCQVQIRRMGISDYDSVYRLWTQGSGIGLNARDDSRDGIARYLSRNPSTCFVAESGDMIVGVILCGHDGRRGYIYHMMVVANRRKEGIGTALVDAALAALKNEGIHKASLVCFGTNETGNGFWEQYGFHERKDLIFRNISLIGEDQNAAR
jgi:N-acetylglutamate synthase